MGTLNPDARNALIFELSNHFEALSGVAWEPLAHRLVELLSGAPMLHRGHSAKGNPQGYSVDSYTYEGELVAEFGTSTDYFYDLDKPKSDYAHARKLIPSAKRVYLLSTQAATAAESTALTAWRVQVIAEDNVELIVYDARRLAEFIVDEVFESDAHFASIADYLEPLRRIRDLHAATNTIPNQIPTAIPRATLEDEIVSALSSYKIALLAGMSGSGKSVSALAVAHSLRDQFAWPIWTTGLELRTVSDLEGVDVTRRGMRMNLRAMLATRSCITILDDLQTTAPLEEVLNELRLALGPEARVIVTSQNIASTPFTIQMPLLSRALSRQLLEFDVAKCPDREFSSIWSAVGGHPMAMRLLNGLAREGTDWNIVAGEAMRVGELAVHEKSARLVDVILTSRRSLLEKPLSVFVWCESPRVHSGVFRRLVGPDAERTLRRLGLLTDDEPDTLRLHDIVWSSLSAVTPALTITVDDFATSLHDFVASLAGNESRTMVLNHLSRLHQPLLGRLVNSSTWLPGHLYAWLHNRGSGRSNNTDLPNPYDLARRAAANGETFLVRVASELAEAFVLSANGARSDESLRNSLLEPFEMMLASTDIGGQEKVFVRHHKAKALKRLGMKREAMSELRAIVSETQNHGSPPAVRLLFARTLLEARSDRTIEQPSENAGAILLSLLDEAKGARNSVSDSVTLAAAELLRWNATGIDVEAVLPSYADFLEPLIIGAALRGLAQGPLTFAALARVWRKIDGAGFWRIFEALPLPAVPTADNADYDAINTLPSWGEILEAAADHHAERRDEFLNLALAFYAASQSGYAKTHQAHLLTVLGSPDRAIEVLRELLLTEQSDRERAWTYHRMSEAHFALKNLVEAQVAARQACEILPQNDKYQGEFHLFLKNCEAEWETIQTGK